MTNVTITQPMLFPWLGMFEQLKLSDICLYLDDVQFSKGSFTNRIQVKSANGTKWMTIPLEGKGSFQHIENLEAAGTGWREEHRSLISQLLSGTPNLNDALGLFDRAYAQSNVCDLLIASMEETAQYLGLRPRQHIARTSTLGIEGRSWRRVLDLVLAVGGTRYITGHGGRKYLDHLAFEASGVEVEYIVYSMVPYAQGDGPFTPYVTVLDPIARFGKDAKTFLFPRTMPWREFIEADASHSR